jgi:hypothetical protein
MISDGLYSKAAAGPGILAILGSPATRSDKSTGIFATLAPPGAIGPYTVLSDVGGSGTPSLAGANSFGSARWQFSCYAATYKAAKQLARAVRMEFEGWQGTLADGTEVDSMVYLGELDSFEDAPALFHVPLDLEIWFRDVGA